MSSSLLAVYASILQKAYPKASPARVELAAEHLIERVRAQGHIESADAASAMGAELEKIITASSDDDAKVLAHGGQR